MRKQVNGRLPVEIELMGKDEERGLSEGLPPITSFPGDAGLDCFSPVEAVVLPHIRAVIPLRFKLAIPEGFAGILIPRSGNAVKRGIQLANTPGLIDSSYRGEVMVTLWNTDDHDLFEIKKGDRIAQLVILPVIGVEWRSVRTLTETDRGEGGYGSTGR